MANSFQAIQVLLVLNPVDGSITAVRKQYTAAASNGFTKWVDSPITLSVGSQKQAGLVASEVFSACKALEGVV